MRELLRDAELSNNISNVQWHKSREGKNDDSRFNKAAFDFDEIPSNEGRHVNS